MTANPESLTMAIRQAENRYHRLVLVVGPPGSGKTALLRAAAEDMGYPCHNLGVDLGRRLLELTGRERPARIGRLLNELMATGEPPVVLLDDLEILFEPSLDIRPLDLLRSASRNRTVVATWCGTHAGGSLTYATPDHPEYQQFRGVDDVTIRLEPDSTACRRLSIP